jgi:hypothetical protein
MIGIARTNFAGRSSRPKPPDRSWAKPGGPRRCIAETKIAPLMLNVVGATLVFVLAFIILHCYSEGASTRIVLIDKKNHVRADTAALALDSREWAEIAAKGLSNRVTFAIRAAKLLDERHGRACRAYGFSPFATADSDGYFVFDCDTPSAPPLIFEGHTDPSATAEVMMACFYVGYVRRHH